MIVRRVRRRGASGPDCPGLLLDGLVLLSWFRPPAAPAGGTRPAAGQPREPPAGAVALTSAPEQKTALRLPFEGVWAVVQGMDSDGTHSGYAPFAVDFVPAEPV